MRVASTTTIQSFRQTMPKPDKFAPVPSIDKYDLVDLAIKDLGAALAPFYADIANARNWSDDQAADYDDLRAQIDIYYTIDGDDAPLPPLTGWHIDGQDYLFAAW